MTIYNGEKFLSQAIESLLSQTYPDITLFISDDASTDGSRSICEKYSKKDERVVYYRQPKNIGMFPNFKFVLDKADGKYFMWAAQDDIREENYIETCVSNLKKLDIGLATTIMAVIDSSGKNITVESELIRLSSKPGYLNVARYVMQPEILGKCNIMYSLFKTDVIKKVWEIYPQRSEWGSDYHFSLAAISHFGFYVDPKILFKKRSGGFSSPNIMVNEIDSVKKIKFNNPNNHIFPFGRFNNYLRGHMEALMGTPYRPLAAFLLLIRLPRSFLIHLRGKNYRKFISRFLHK